MATEQLTCEHGHTFTRERVRGRKPKACPDHRDNSLRAPEPAPDPKPTPKRKRRSKTSYEQLSGAAPSRPLASLPLAQRTSGWCTDYDPAPDAQHHKCDGDLGRYRCPCDCHGWS